jgi:hypothetical protein
MILDREHLQKNRTCYLHQQGITDHYYHDLRYKVKEGSITTIDMVIPNTPSPPFELKPVEIDFHHQFMSKCHSGHWNRW